MTPEAEAALEDPAFTKWWEGSRFAVIDGPKPILLAIREVAFAAWTNALAAVDEARAHVGAEDAAKKERLLAVLRTDTGDHEADHCNSDEALLRYIGDPEVTDAFNAGTKWYA